MTTNPLTDPSATLGLLAQRVDAAADEQQQQIDALEQLLLNRATLVNIEQSGAKMILTFTRRGQVHRIEAHASMSTDIAALRRELIE